MCTARRWSSRRPDFELTFSSHFFFFLAFGVLGALWPILNRALMATIWYGGERS